MVRWCAVVCIDYLPYPSRSADYRTGWCAYCIPQSAEGGPHLAVRTPRDQPTYDQPLSLDQMTQLRLQGVCNRRSHYCGSSGNLQMHGERREGSTRHHYRSTHHRRTHERDRRGRDHTRCCDHWSSRDTVTRCCDQRKWSLAIATVGHREGVADAMGSAVGREGHREERWKVRSAGACGARDVVGAEVSL